MKAADIMSREVHTISPETTVEEIASLLSDKDISGVPVVDEHGKIMGIVSRRDLLYKDVEPKLPPFLELLGGFVFLGSVKESNEQLRKYVALRAEEIMTRDVVTVSEDTDVDRVAGLMADKNINRIPVARDGRLVGIIGRADVVRYIADMMKKQ